MRSKVIAIVFLVFFSFVTSHAAPIESVSVVSKWSGLGKPQNSRLIIGEKNGKYYADGMEIPGEYIAQLEAALDAPEMPVLNLENLGVTQAWLDANAVSSFAECCVYNLPRAGEKQLFVKKFRDIRLMEKVIAAALRGGHTDDYPRVDVSIKRGNETINLSSTAQKSFMLPWEMTSADKKIVTYNADISRAIARLLPAKFTNLDRLSGEQFKLDISFGIMNEVSDETTKRLKNQKKR